MKVRLAYRDRDLDLGAAPPRNVDDLTGDLGLEIVCAAMAGGDGYLLEVARRTLVVGLDDPEAIRYRQAVLSDCLDHPDAVRQLYGLAVEAIEGERRVWGYTTRMPETLLHRSTDVMEVMGGMLRRLRSIADEQGGGFRSDGFRRLFDEIHRELDDAYLATVAQHVERLRFHDGVVVSATLGAGNRGEAYTLRRRVKPRTWRERIGLTEPDSYAWDLPERDEAGAQALGELQARGIALAAVALAQSADHVLSYFVQLRAELGFYLGCLELHAILTRKGEPVCLPDPLPVGPPALQATGLYDVALSLSSGGRAIVGNDVDADGMTLLMVTGPNRGGKSTFLRSLGLAQLMMQAGMFVAARSFRADIRPAVFTHFRREEDADLERGKFDEELARMSAIVDLVTPTSLVLCNESFASTNEREGSEVARQVLRALLEAGVKVAYVTHMFDLASGFHAERAGDALFLRAERLPDGRRTFRLVEGEPLPTSHGEDIYRRIFGPDGGEGRADPGEVA